MTSPKPSLEDAVKEAVQKAKLPSMSATQKTVLRERLMQFVEAHPASSWNFLHFLRPAFAGLMIFVGFSGVSVAAAHDALPGETLYPVQVLTKDYLKPMFMDEEEKREYLLGRLEESLEIAAQISEEGALEESAREDLREQLEHYLLALDGVELAATEASTTASVDSLAEAPALQNESKTVEEDHDSKKHSQGLVLLLSNDTLAVVTAHDETLLLTVLSDEQRVLNAVAFEEKDEHRDGSRDDDREEDDGDEHEEDHEGSHKDENGRDEDEQREDERDHESEDHHDEDPVAGEISQPAVAADVTDGADLSAVSTGSIILTDDVDDDVKGSPDEEEEQVEDESADEEESDQVNDDDQEEEEEEEEGEEHEGRDQSDDHDEDDHEESR